MPNSLLLHLQFFSSAVSRSSARVVQPAAGASISCSTAASNNLGSAEQPARETADVQWWLKKNEVVESSSAEAMRIREVVEALSTKPKPRQESIERFSLTVKFYLISRRVLVEFLGTI